MRFLWDSVNGLFSKWIKKTLYLTRLIPEHCTLGILYHLSKLCWPWMMFSNFHRGLGWIWPLFLMQSVISNTCYVFFVEYVNYCNTSKIAMYIFYLSLMDVCLKIIKVQGSNNDFKHPFEWWSSPEFFNDCGLLRCQTIVGKNCCSLKEELRPMAPKERTLGYIKVWCKPFQELW